MRWDYGEMTEEEEFENGAEDSVSLFMFSLLISLEHIMCSFSCRALCMGVINSLFLPS